MKFRLDASSDNVDSHLQILCQFGFKIDIVNSAPLTKEYELDEDPAIWMRHGLPFPSQRVPWEEMEDGSFIRRRSPKGKHSEFVMTEQRLNWRTVREVRRVFSVPIIDIIFPDALTVAIKKVGHPIILQEATWPGFTDLPLFDLVIDDDHWGDHL